MLTKGESPELSKTDMECTKKWYNDLVLMYIFINLLMFIIIIIFFFGGWECRWVSASTSALWFPNNMELQKLQWTIPRIPYCQYIT